MKIYVVQYTTGRYEEQQNVLVEAFADEAKAKALVASQIAYMAELRKGKSSIGSCMGCPGQGACSHDYERCKRTYCVEEIDYTPTGGEA